MKNTKAKKTETIALCVDADTKKILQLIAEEQGRTESDTARRLLAPIIWKEWARIQQEKNPQPPMKEAKFVK